MSSDAVATPAVSDPGPAQSFLYDAFISYDHDDRSVASGIQRGLHRIGRRWAGCARCMSSSTPTI